MFKEYQKITKFWAKPMTLGHFGKIISGSRNNEYNSLSSHISDETDGVAFAVDFNPEMYDDMYVYNRLKWAPKNHFDEMR